MTGPYGTAARDYWRNGWTCPLPLPPGAKEPPPGGFTGAGARLVSVGDLERWARLHSAGNVAVRMLAPIIGLDVDAYDGNATNAARAAGYTGNYQTLRRMGADNMAIPAIAAAIKARQEARQAGPRAKRIATREERQAFWTESMLDTSQKLGDRLKAAELLGRSEADFTDKLQVDARVTLETLLARAAESK